MKRILVAEDEETIREFVVLNLKRAGYEVSETDNGKLALETYENSDKDFDIAVLDVMMPEMDGLALCKELRKKNNNIGIILLTAKAQEIDKVSGLMYGADDYMTKPFSPSELVARVDALYRRVAIAQMRVENNFKEDLIIGDFRLNLRSHILFKNEKPIDLTHTEFKIMELFFSNPSISLQRDNISKHVWHSSELIDEKIVDVNIRRLRMKIEDNPSKPEHIITVWGYGYKWV